MSANTPADLHRAHRAAKALRLRLNGATYRDIADALDVSPGTVHADITRALADIPRPEADALRELEVTRLDALQLACWDDATAGNLAAIDRCVKIIVLRARLLGLDAPQQVQLATADVDLDATVERIMRVVDAATTTATTEARPD